MAEDLDDTLIALEGGGLVMTTVLPDPSLCEPSLGPSWGGFDDAIYENLGNAPSFFGQCAGGVSTVEADCRFRIKLWIRPFTPRRIL